MKRTVMVMVGFLLPALAGGCGPEMGEVDEQEEWSPTPPRDVRPVSGVDEQEKHDSQTGKSTLPGVSSGKNTAQDTSGETCVVEGGTTECPPPV